MTDITEHPTREGKLYCAVVLDAFSRMIVGWAIDTTQTTRLVTDALSMAVHRRGPHQGLILHSDRGVQFTSWTFSQKIRDAGIAPSMGAVGSPYDNAMVEAFRGRMQVELLNRARWKTRVDLATAISDYIDRFHNTRRRHSALGMLTPTEYEHHHTINAAKLQNRDSTEMGSDHRSPSNPAWLKSQGRQSRAPTPIQWPLLPFRFTQIHCARFRATNSVAATVSPIRLSPHLHEAIAVEAERSKTTTL